MPLGSGSNRWPERAAPMLVTRIHTGDDGESHFAELDLPLAVSELGAMSSPIPTRSVFLRDTSESGPEVYDFHVAPRRQLVVHLRGVTEIEVGSGERRRFGPGDVLLADDLTGRGHVSREVEGPRLQLFAVLADEADLGY